MKLIDVKDDNGLSIQAAVDYLAGKCDECGLRHILIFARKGEDGKPDVAMVSNVSRASLGQTLEALARELRGAVSEKVEKKVVEA